MEMKEALWTTEPLFMTDDPEAGQEGKDITKVGSIDDAKYLLNNYWPRKNYQNYSFTKAYGPSK